MITLQTFILFQVQGRLHVVMIGYYIADIYIVSGSRIFHVNTVGYHDYI